MPIRWVMIGLVFFATLINFIDRLTITVLAPVITESLKLSNVQYASISTWFLVAYSASQALSGRLYDKIGNRRGFTFSVTVWSIAAMLHATARGLGSLSAFRFLLGIGEAGNWPGAAKVVGEWFPARERAFAMSIFNSGAALGSVIAPPVIIALQIRFGWEATFLVTGGLGLVWLAAWLKFYYPPAEHPRMTQAELDLLEEDRVASGDTGIKLSYGALLGYRKTWAIVIARFFADPAWWLYITWLPLYLSRVHGFDLKQIGLFAWVPYVAADAGSLLGGYASGFLMSRGWSLNRARKTVIVISALMMGCGYFAARSTTSASALAWIAVVLFGFQAWINNVQVLPSDFFAASNTGTVAGMGGLAAGLGAIVFTMTTGWVVDHFSYTPILIAASILPLIGTAVLLLLGGRFEPCKLTET
ncbi:MAG: MFS transporter [Bryobacteraceae bacterium]